MLTIVDHADHALLMKKGKESRARFVARTGIGKWGIPVAFGWAILTTARSRGFTWNSFFSFDFLQTLVVGLLVLGLLGGWIWGRLMWSTFSTEDDHEE